MSAAVQTLLVALIVLAAAAYVGRRAWRALRPALRPGRDASCAHGCGCADASAREEEDWARTQ